MGGDFYDVFQIDANRLGLVVADVSGKGVPAAFFMAVARTELRGSAMTGLSPGQVLRRVNNILCRENPLELFVTVFYAILDVESGLLTYANGGHNPPLVTHFGEVTALPLCQGTALGVLPELDYLEKQHSYSPVTRCNFIPMASPRRLIRITRNLAKHVCRRSWPDKPPFRRRVDGLKLLPRCRPTQPTPHNRMTSPA